MIVVFAVAVSIVVAAGVYLALSRDVFRCVVGLSLLGAAVNLVVFGAGRIGAGQPPILQAGETVLASGTNPLPQALVLTAIVIGFAFTAFSFLLAVRVMKAAGTDDVDALRAAEPAPTDAVEPPLEPAGEDAR